MCNASWLLIALSVTAIQSSPFDDRTRCPRREDDLEQKIDELFAKLIKEEFNEVTSVTSGPPIRLPSGREVYWPFLAAQAKDLIAMGKAAVPGLLVWANSDNIACRFVAVYSLERITGLSTRTQVFHTQRDFSGERAEAISMWRRWWEKETSSRQIEVRPEECSIVLCGGRRHRLLARGHLRFKCRLQR
jgi:hypothetical protein